MNVKIYKYYVKNVIKLNLKIRIKMDIEYLNELYREKQGDEKFKQFYSDIIDLLKYKSDTYKK